MLSFSHYKLSLFPEFQLKLPLQLTETFTVYFSL